MDSKDLRNLSEAWDNIVSTKEEIDQLDEAQNKGVSASVGGVKIGVTDPKTDIGARASRAIGSTISNIGSTLGKFGSSAETAINKLSGYNKPSVAKPKPSGDVIVKAAKGGVPGTLNKTTGKWSPTSTAPARRPPAATAPVARLATTKPAPAAQTGNKAADMATWAKANPTLAARVTPSGTQRGTGQSTMSKQAADLRSMQAASQQRQAAQSGPMYSSPDVKSKMSARTKTMLGLKDSYDIVLDYLFSQGHVDTLEEAHYVMMEMDAECVQSIVEAVYGGGQSPTDTPADKKTMVVTQADKTANTKAWQNYKAGVPGYSAAAHLKGV